MSDESISPAMSQAATKFIKPTSGKLIARYGQFIQDNPYSENLNLDGVLLLGGGIVKSASDGIVIEVHPPTNSSIGDIKSIASRRLMRQSIKTFKT